HIQRAQAFYEKHGGKAIVLARFVPVVRTFAPIVAGIGSMEYRRFVTFNMVGGFFWAVGVTTAGYVLGSSIPDIDRYLLPIVVLIVVISVLPAAYHMLREPETRQALRNSMMRLFARSTEA
ncbi:MAG: VTT domain-containing protein, partial [Anaerolineae bacterium]|nr:VTT domain-containing protein [Anaerolineae bacterium]